MILVRGRAPTILPVFLLRARSLEPRYKYIMVPLDNDNRYSRTGNFHFSVNWYRKSWPFLYRPLILPALPSGDRGHRLGQRGMSRQLCRVAKLPSQILQCNNTSFDRSALPAVTQYYAYMPLYEVHSNWLSISEDESCHGQESF